MQKQIRKHGRMQGRSKAGTKAGNKAGNKAGTKAGNKAEKNVLSLTDCYDVGPSLKNSGRTLILIDPDL